MAGKKKTDVQQEEQHTEQSPDQEADKYQQMEARLEKTIDDRFERFEKTMERFFAAPASSPPKKRGTKRPAPPPENTHDTRNKALRSKYNNVTPRPSEVLIDNEDSDIQEYDSRRRRSLPRRRRAKPHVQRGLVWLQMSTKMAAPRQSHRFYLLTGLLTRTWT